MEGIKFSFIFILFSVSILGCADNDVNPASVPAEERGATMQEMKSLHGDAIQDGRLLKLPEGRKDTLVYEFYDNKLARKYRHTITTHTVDAHNTYINYRYDTIKYLRNPREISEINNKFGGNIEIKLDKEYKVGASNIIGYDYSKSLKVVLEPLGQEKFNIHVIQDLEL